MKDQLALALLASQALFAALALNVKGPESEGGTITETAVESQSEELQRLLKRYAAGDGSHPAGASAELPVHSAPFGETALSQHSESNDAEGGLSHSPELDAILKKYAPGNTEASNISSMDAKGSEEEGSKLEDSQTVFDKTAPSRSSAEGSESQHNDLERLLKKYSGTGTALNTSSRTEAQTDAARADGAQHQFEFTHFDSELSSQDSKAASRHSTTSLAGGKLTGAIVNAQLLRSVDPNVSAQLLRSAERGHVPDDSDLNDLLKKYGAKKSQGSAKSARDKAGKSADKSSAVVDDLMAEYGSQRRRATAAGGGGGAGGAGGGGAAAGGAAAGGAAPGAAAGAVPGVAPGTVPGNAPGVAPGTVPGTAPGTVPGVAPAAMPPPIVVVPPPPVVPNNSFDLGNYNLMKALEKERIASGITTVEITERTRTVKHATASKVYFSLCKTETECLDEHRLKNMLSGRVKSFEFQEPNLKYEHEKPKLPYLKLVASNDDAWFPDYIEATLVSGEGIPLLTEHFELDGWLEGPPQEAGRKDETGPGHPLFHKEQLLVGGGPKILVTVKTSKLQATPNMGLIRLHPCESEDKCMLGYVKLRDLHPGAVQIFEANLWQDVSEGKGALPISQFNGVRLEVADPECDDRVKMDECQEKHADDCWQGFELEVTIEGMKDADRTIVPSSGMLCRNPGKMPALADVGGDASFVAGSKIYLPAGVWVYVNLTTHEDSGVEVIPGPANLKICESESACVGSMNLTDIRPGTNQSFKFLVVELTKADAVNFVLDGLLWSWKGGKAGGVHFSKIVVQIEEFTPKTFLTDGWLVGNTDIEQPPCTNYWAKTRYIRGGSTVRFTVGTGADAGWTEKVQGPACATLCSKSDDCLPSSILIRGGNALAPGSETQHEGILEELVQGSDDLSDLVKVKLSAASKTSRPWHVVSVKVELLVHLPQNTWALPLQLVADHWITPQDIEPGRPCWNNWGSGPLVVGDVYERMKMRVKSRSSSMPVPGPVCLSLCKDDVGQDCADEQVAVANLRPGHDTHASGVVKKKAKAPITVQMLGAAEEAAWYARSLTFEVPWEKHFDTNGWLLPGKGFNGQRVLEGVRDTCWNWKEEKHLLRKSLTYGVVKALTVGGLAEAASDGPVCLHLCEGPGNCLESTIPLLNLVPGQWLSYEAVLEDESVTAGKVPDVKGVDLVAKTSEEWLCDKVRVGFKVMPKASAKEELPEEPELHEFWVRQWLDRPAETKEYPLAPHYPLATASTELFVGMGPFLEVTVRTRGDAGREGGSNGTITLHICESRDLCLEQYVTLDYLNEGTEQTFEVPVYDAPATFKMKAVSIKSWTTDAWLVETLKVKFKDVEMSWDLNGWLVSDLPPPRKLLVPGEFVASSRFLAAGAKGKTQVYVYGDCAGPLEVRPCPRKDICEDGLHFEGPLEMGKVEEHQGKVESVYDADSFKAEYVKVTHQGPGDCRIGYVSFELAGKDLGRFSTVSEDLELLPSTQIAKEKAQSQAFYALKSNTPRFMEAMEKVELQVETAAKPDAASDGPISVALCDLRGTLCMNRYIFLAKVGKTGRNQKFRGALPLKRVTAKYPEWVPHAFFISSLVDHDAWMVDSLTLKGELVPNNMVAFAMGWMSRTRAFQGIKYPGNFWAEEMLLQTGGSRLRLTVDTDNELHSSSEGGVEVEVCATEKLCSGMLRLTSLTDGSTGTEFLAPLGNLHADFFHVNMVKLKAVSTDAWCARRVFVQIEPVGSSPLPSTLKGEKREFTMGACLNTHDGEMVLHWGARVRINVTTHEDTNTLREVVDGPAELRLCEKESKCVGKMMLGGLVPGTTQSFEIVVPELTREEANKYDLEGMHIEWSDKNAKWHLAGLTVQIEQQKPKIFITDGWFVADNSERKPCTNYWQGSRYIVGGARVRWHFKTSLDGIEGEKPPGPVCATLCVSGGCLKSSALIGDARYGGRLALGEETSYEVVVEEPEVRKKPLTEVKLKAAHEDSQPWHVEAVRAEVLEEGRQVEQSLEILADHWVTTPGASPEHPCANNWGESSLTLEPNYEPVQLVLSSKPESMAVQDRVCISLCREKDGSGCPNLRILVQSLEPGKEVQASGLISKGFPAPAALKLEGPTKASEAWFAESIVVKAGWEKRFETNGWLLPKAGANADVKALLSNTCWNWKSHTHTLSPATAYVSVEVLTMPAGPEKTGSQGPFCARMCKSKGDCLDSWVLLERLTAGQTLTFQGVVDDRGAIEEMLPDIGGVQLEAKTEEEWFCDRVKIGITRGKDDKPRMTDFTIDTWMDRPADFREHPHPANSASTLFVGAGDTMVAKVLTSSAAGTEGGCSGIVSVYPCKSRDNCLDQYVRLEGLEAGEEQTFRAAVYDPPSGFEMNAVRLVPKTTDAWLVESLEVTYKGKTMKWPNLNGWLSSTLPPERPFTFAGSFAETTRFLAAGADSETKIYTFQDCAGPVEVQPCSSKQLCEDPLKVQGPLKAGVPAREAGEIESIAKPGEYNVEYLRVWNKGPGECKIGWVSFRLADRDLGLFGPSSSGVSLVPAANLAAEEVVKSLYTLGSNSTWFLEPQNTAKLSVTAPDVQATDAKTEGPVAVALCNMEGSACLPRFFFLAHIHQKSKDGEFLGALPLSQMDQRSADWDPTALEIISLTDHDAWMFDTMKLSGERIAKTLEFYGDGWVSRLPPQNTKFPGNFWKANLLLTSGGTKLKLTIVSDDTVGASCEGGLKAWICDTPKLCHGPIRVSQLEGGKTGVFTGPLGLLHADFRHVNTVKLQSTTSDTFCAKRLFAEVLPIGDTPLPNSLGSKNKREFSVGQCMDSSTGVVELHYGATVYMNITTHEDTNPAQKAVGPAEFQICKSSDNCVGTMIVTSIAPGKTESFTFVVPELTKEQGRAYQLKGMYIKWKDTELPWHLVDLSVAVEDQYPARFLTDGWFTPEGKDVQTPCTNYQSQNRYITFGKRVRFTFESALDSGGDNAERPGPACAQLCYDDGCLESRTLIGGKRNQELAPGERNIYEAIVEHDDKLDKELESVRLSAAHPSIQPWHVMFARAELLNDAGQATQSMETMADHWLTAQDFKPHRPCANNFGESVLNLAPVWQPLTLTLISKPESMVVQSRVCVRLCKKKNGQDCAEQMTVVEGLEPSKEVMASGLVHKDFTTAPASLKLTGPKDGSDAWFAESISVKASWYRQFETNGWLLPAVGESETLSTLLSSTCWNWKEHEHTISPVDKYVTVTAYTMPGPEKTGSEGPFCVQLCQSKTKCLDSKVLLQRLVPGQAMTFRGVVDDPEMIQLGGMRLEARTGEEWFCDKIDLGVSDGQDQPSKMVGFSIRRWLDRVSPTQLTPELKTYPVVPEGAQNIFVGLTVKLKVVAETSGSEGPKGGCVGPVDVFPCSARDNCLDTPISLMDLEPGATQTFEVGAFEMPEDFDLQGVLVKAPTKDAWMGKKLTVEIVGGKSAKKIEVNLNNEWFSADGSEQGPRTGAYGDNPWPGLIAQARFAAPSKQIDVWAYSLIRCAGNIEVRPCRDIGDCESAITITGPLGVGELKKGSGKVTTSVSKEDLDIRFVEVKNKDPKPCGFSTVMIKLDGQSQQAFGAPTEGAALVPMSELRPSVTEFMVEPDGVLLLAKQEWMNLQVKTTSETASGSVGPVAVAPCDETGTQCLNRFVFLAGMLDNEEQFFKGAMPLATFDFFKPRAVFLSNMGEDAWMVEKILTNSDFFPKVQSLGVGWVANQDVPGLSWPGNFWSNTVLLPANGVALEVTAKTAHVEGPAIKFSTEAVTLQACAREGLCASRTLRMTGMREPDTEYTFLVNLGSLASDFLEVNLMELTTSTKEAWCAWTIKTKFVPVYDKAPLPAAMNKNQKTFLADGCLTADAATSSAAITGALNHVVTFIKTGVTIYSEGPKLTIVTKSIVGTEGPMMVALCSSEKHCAAPVALRDLKSEKTQTFEFFLSMDKVDFVPMGVRITAETDDSWRVDKMTVTLEGKEPQVVRMDGWFEKNADVSRHAGDTGRFVVSSKYFGAGPEVVIETETQDCAQGGSTGPFELTICQSKVNCLDGSVIPLTNLEPGPKQVFKANVPQLLNFPDFQVGGFLLKSLTKDAWAPKRIKAIIADNKAALELHTHIWLDEEPVSATQYSLVEGKLAYMVANEVYLDSCTMMSCQRSCELKVTWDGAGQRSQDGFCKCNFGEVLNDDGRTCRDEYRQSSAPAGPVR